jgi:hypothetical protein
MAESPSLKSYIYSWEVAFLQPVVEHSLELEAASLFASSSNGKI